VADVHTRPLAGDRPIESPDQDAIGRVGFARQIQLEIESARRDEGLVVAVTGEWGSGKTSVINLALRPLEQHVGYRVIHFNPWLFSGTPQLVEHFFAELRAQLGASGNTRLKDIGEALERYGSTIDPLRFVPGVEKAAALGRSLGRALKGSTQSVERQRSQLNGLLSRHDELLVIVVDDIDRLRDEEVADVMRLVRLVADFPNTVYVLAFDADRVAQAVSSHGVEDGREYIEKIVQVAHEVPTIAGEQLSNLLLERIGQATEGIAYRLDTPHWSRLYLTFRSYFETPRDVSRYCNHLRSPLVLLGKEIEAADVLTLEVLRLFERGFWAELPHLIPELTSTSEGPSIVSGSREPEGARLAAAIEAGGRADTLRELLVQLFPAAGRYLGGSAYGADFLGTWQRQRRVAHPSVLQIYLSKQVQPTEVPTPLVERVVGLLDSPEALRAELEGLSGSQLGDLLSRLEDYENEFPEGVGAALPVLYELSSRLPPPEGMFGIEPRMRVSRVVLRMLRNRDPAAVEKTVADALERIRLLSDRWSLVRLVGHREGSGSRLVSADDATRAERELVESVMAASAAQLAAEPELGRLISLVLDAEPAEAHAKFREDAENDEFLTALIAAHLHEVRSDTGRHIQLRWDLLTNLLGEDLLIRRVQALPDPPERRGADVLELVAQARRYAGDPESAARELQEYRRTYGG
jgi:KAP family P-loop domain